MLYISILVVYCRTNVSRNYRRSILLFEQKREQNYDTITDNGKPINTYTFECTGEFHFYNCPKIWRIFFRLIKKHHLQIRNEKYCKIELSTKFTPKSVSIVITCVFPHSIRVFNLKVCWLFDYINKMSSFSSKLYNIYNIENQNNRSKDNCEEIVSVNYIFIVLIQNVYHCMTHNR